MKKIFFIFSFMFFSISCYSQFSKEKTLNFSSLDNKLKDIISIDTIPFRNNYKYEIVITKKKETIYFVSFYDSHQEITGYIDSSGKIFWFKKFLNYKNLPLLKK